MRRLILALTLATLAACAPQDPSKYDLKSPCVSSGSGIDDPCLQRPLQLNNPKLENISA